MVISWVNFYYDNIKFTFKFIFSRRNIDWKTIPVFEEFQAIANNRGVKLNKDKPFGVQAELNNAYANFFTRQIILGDELLKELTREQLLALFGHELTHLEKNHNMRILIGTLSFSSLVYLPLTYTQAPSIILNLVCLAGIFMALLFVSWNNEYSADTGGANLAGPRAMMSVLRNVVPKEQWRRESETHPSVYSRVRKLRKLL